MDCSDITSFSADDDFETPPGICKMLKELKWDQERLSSRLIRLEHEFVEKEKAFLQLEKTNCLKYQELLALLDHMKETTYQARIKELEEATQKLNTHYAKNVKVMKARTFKIRDSGMCWGFILIYISACRTQGKLPNHILDPEQDLKMISKLSSFQDILNDLYEKYKIDPTGTADQPKPDPPQSIWAKCEKLKLYDPADSREIVIPESEGSGLLLPGPYEPYSMNKIMSIHLQAYLRWAGLPYVVIQEHSSHVV
ncbi:hypothetical protein DFH27DRAFT_599460 [Peziza echinospora]|nr:hypothetical protein DFH27DRAFT_599460 [Peziza echinospora]